MRLDDVGLNRFRERWIWKLLFLAGLIVSMAGLAACGGGGSGPVITPPPDSTPINGQCGASVNQCVAGSFAGLTDSGADYRWRCDGENGGANRTCTAPIPPQPVNGQCGVLMAVQNRA